MRAPTKLTVTVFAVSAALTLTACGGSDAKAPAGIKGAAQGQSASPSPSGPSGVQRPTITFPSDAKNLFEGQRTGDPKKDAVLIDNADGINSVDQAILSGNLKLPALSFYNTGEALTSAITYIQGYVKKGDTWVGTTRYFDQKVSFNNDGSASAVYCSDETKSFIKHRDGKIDHTPSAASDAYVLYNARLAQDKQGIWQATNVISNRGAKECQP